MSLTARPYPVDIHKAQAIVGSPLKDIVGDHDAASKGDGPQPFPAAHQFPPSPSPSRHPSRHSSTTRGLVDQRRHHDATENVGGGPVVDWRGARD